MGGEVMEEETRLRDRSTCITDIDQVGDQKVAEYLRSVSKGKRCREKKTPVPDVIPSYKAENPFSVEGKGKTPRHQLLIRLVVDNARTIQRKNNKSNWVAKQDIVRCVNSMELWNVEKHIPEYSK